MLNSGIYKIVNLVNNKLYIGSSKNLKNRQYLHFYELRNNKHTNSHLQYSFNKYGSKNFQFVVLANCPKEYCIVLEQWFIDILKPEYNKAPRAGNNLGFKQSEEAKRKISEGNKKWVRTEEYRKNCSISKKGKPRPKWITDKLKEINTGKKFTQEHKDKLKKAYSKREFKGNRAVLNEEKVKEIKLLLKEGKSLSYIGRIYNISSPMVSRIKNNVAWKEVQI